MDRRLFGTNGVRGIANQDMGPQLALDLGKAIGEYMRGEVALGTDTRTSAHILKNTLASGLMSSGSNVLDLGTLPTPALQYYVKRHQVSGGVMVTASHNPPEFNGVKCVDADGTEMPRYKEERIEEIYFRRSFTPRPWKEVGQMREEGGVIEEYLSSILSNVDVHRIKESHLTVVLDCANGAGSVTAPALLDRLDVRAITLNCNPMGTFPGHPSEPTPENLGDLIAMVAESSADLGIAQDGDADRAILVDGEGNYIYGDRSLALVAGYMVEGRGGTVVTPISSSSCVEEVVRRAGGELVYTKVGAPIVARKMMEIGAVFGGEENGGLIFPNHQHCRDAAMALAKVLEIVARKGALSDLLAEIPSYFLDKRRIPCPDELKQELLDEVVEKEGNRRVDTTDGAKIYFEDGWTLIRPSGTEPLIRIYSEAREQEVAGRRGEEYERMLSELISSAPERAARRG
jgi:phosphomannomutase / phosphoglucomutase